MSSEEDFSLVLEPSEETLEGVQALIQKQKQTYEQLVADQKELQTSINESQTMTQMFQKRAEDLRKALEEDQELNMESITQEQERLSLMQQEETELKQELDRVMKDLDQEEQRNQQLRLQADVFSGAPEKVVVFKGHTGRPHDPPQFEMKPEVLYPMEGGTALVTFEDPAVAKNIVMKRKHKVDLGGEFHITVEARFVPITRPQTVEIDAEVCPRRVLVSELTQMDKEMLEDKLFIHFSQRKYGGGEVDHCELLPESGHAIITFIEDNVAKGLTDREYQDVMLADRKKHRVRVTPFVNGRITNLETRTKLCSQTVLLTGIVDVADPETLQDLLEIHFQKSTNGGGEIEAFLYCPEGQSKTAVFQKPQRDTKDED